MQTPETVPVLTHDEQAERSLISLLLSHPNLYANLQEQLPDDIFYDAKASLIFKCIKEVDKDGDEIDMVSVTMKAMQAHPEISAYDIAMIADEDKSNDASYLVRVLNSLRQRRRMWMLGKSVASKCEGLDGNIIEIIEEFRKNLESISEVDKKYVFSLEDTVADVMKDVNARRNPEWKPNGTMTGFMELDRVGGFQPADLVIVAAESSSGKTSFAMSATLNAIKRGRKVAFYSMEMTRQQLAARLLSMETGISSSAIRNEPLCGFELDRLAAKQKEIVDTMSGRLFFDDRSTSNLDTILASIRSMKLKYDIDGVVVDYIQILSVNMGGRKSTTEEQIIGEAARRLKNIAKDLGIWVMTLSQLSRDRENPEPNLNRMRGSGQINEAADITLLIYRPEAVKPFDSMRTFPEPFKDKDIRGTAMVTVAKGRNTGTCEFLCGFDANRTLFYPKDIKDIGPHVGVPSMTTNNTKNGVSAPF
ncbi:MAG: replicative DNA helicase [Paludibacteraceae bacterium]|nr:replicative DNA helicase [Paludibacteraceae bacterium]